MLATDYPFLDVMWTMVIFFVWILWFWLLFTVFADIFRRHDLSGLGKTGWIVFAILLPFLGVFIYLITQNVGMTERNLQRSRAMLNAQHPPQNYCKFIEFRSLTRFHPSARATHVRDA